MDKQKAISFIINNLSEKDAKLVFRTHINLYTLEQLVVGLPTEDLSKLRSIIGEFLWRTIKNEISTNKESITTLGYSIARNQVLALVEDLRSENLISLEFQLDPNEHEWEKKADLARVNLWLENNKDV